jgi:uncharacterized membrane protein
VFGIRGLDGFGLVHALIGLVALLVGLAVITLPKGTRLHRKVGFAYVTAMAALNLTALWIFDLTGRFNPFHFAAIISLATIIAGWLPVAYRRPREWMVLHGIVMGWAYVGLVAAFLAEIAVRVPWHRLLEGRHHCRGDHNRRRCAADSYARASDCSAHANAAG